jgi:hypothetical protein
MDLGFLKIIAKILGDEELSYWNAPGSALTSTIFP